MVHIKIKNHKDKKENGVLKIVQREIHKLKRETMLPTKTLNGRDVMFPERLRVKGRVAYNSLYIYTASNVNNQYMVINDPINVYAAQNMSGLRWLLSSTSLLSAANAPYSQGIVRKAHIKVYAKTVEGTGNSSGALITMFPLSFGQATATYSLPTVEEQFGRSSIIALPSVNDTTSHKKPQITKHYNCWDIVGVSEAEYMNNTTAYGFVYNGLITPANVVTIDLFLGTESNMIDALLQTRVDIIVELEMELFNKNNNTYLAPI